MENLEPDMSYTSRSNCRVGKITAKEYIEESELTPEKDFQK
ncbi:hypothetical protein [Flavobacterium petrolei]|jgi:hypothetical protein